jgi:phage FluMu protein Com
VRNTQSNPTDDVAEFRCPDCNKLLMKTILRVENMSLSPEQFKVLIDGVRIKGGVETKCRNCKKIRQTERTFSLPVAV